MEKTYVINMFDKNGKKLENSFDVVFNGTVGSKFKEYYRRFAKTFFDARAEMIEVTEKV